jgi:cellobiose-specific phosphotransferase system component IIA
MDANGNEQLILQFATLCRGEKLSEGDIRLGNADQNTIVPPLKPGQDLESLELYRCSSSLGVPHRPWPPSPPPVGLWKTFRFTHSKVAKLKAQASVLCSTDSDAKYISSDDAVSTFIWTRVSKIRSAWLPEDSNTMLFRAVNGRRKLNPEIPAGYMGHSILLWPTKLPLQNVINDDLSSTTIKVRRALMQVNDGHMRSFFYLLQNEKDKTTFNYGATANHETDMLMTSFAAQKLYKTYFGAVLGKPVSR